MGPTASIAHTIHAYNSREDIPQAAFPSQSFSSPRVSNRCSHIIHVSGYASQVHQDPISAHVPEYTHIPPEKISTAHPYQSPLFLCSFVPLFFLPLSVFEPKCPCTRLFPETRSTDPEPTSTSPFSLYPKMPVESLCCWRREHRVSQKTLHCGTLSTSKAGRTLWSPVR